MKSEEFRELVKPIVESAVDGQLNDSTLEILNSVADTLENEVAEESENGESTDSEYKTKYEELKQKYIDAFMNGRKPEESEDSEDSEESEESVTIENLFDEEEDE